MIDRIEKLGNSVIQHGKLNDRIYLIKLDPSDLSNVLKKMNSLAIQHQYSKIFAKVPSKLEAALKVEGFTEEARIPFYFIDGDDALFMSRFLDPVRSEENQSKLVDDILKEAQTKNIQENSVPVLPAEFRLISAGPEMAPELAAVYRQVFATYPFPIHDPEYLRETMPVVRYYAVQHNGHLVAVASADTDQLNGCVEMTDFATSKAYRGKSLAQVLLHHMDKEMLRTGQRIAFTIARAYSYGMNITFAKLGYTFSGTLINNTNIYGSLQSMNVWYKTLTC
jgi:putative beta-lysine N-acetyltransferase